MRQGGMPSFAAHGQVNFVGGGHVASAANPDVAGGQLWVHVLAQNVGRCRVGQHAGRHHARGAPGEELFSRLENASHRALPCVARGLKQLNGTEQ